MRRKTDSDELFWTVAAFILPCLILLMTADRTPAGMFNSVIRQTNDIDSMRQIMERGRIFYPGVLSDILTRRFYPSYILALIIGGKEGGFIVRIFYYIRLGLLSFGVYLFSWKHVRNGQIWSLLLGYAYAFSTIAVAGATNPQILNVMIVMPFAACAVETLMRDHSSGSFWICVLVLSFFSSGGIYGITTGIIYVLSIILIFKNLLGLNVGKVLKAWGVSLILELPVMIPLAFSGLEFIKIGEELKNSRVSFVFFDFLTSFLDGTAFNIPEGNTYASMGISVFVLMLVLLFFINRAIPFKAKMTAVLMIIIYEVLSSWSLANSLLSVYGNSGTTSFSRLTGLCVILFVLAAVSLRNVKILRPSDIYLASFAILALIIIANSSSSGEVSRSAFNIWFSAAAAIFWGVFFSVYISKESRLFDIAAFIGLIGITVNLFYCFSVSDMTGNLPSISPFAGTAQATDSCEIFDDDFPLSGEDPRFITVEGDLRNGTEDLEVPEILNIISRSTVFNDLFELADTFTVFSTGISEVGIGRYYTMAPGIQSEILVRAENLDPSARYYIYSSFTGDTDLVETYGQEDIASSYSGPYLKLLERQTNALTLRQTGITSQENSYFSLWKADEDIMRDFLLHIEPMTDYGGNITDEGSQAQGSRTIVTSVLYSESFRIKVMDEDGNVCPCDTFNLGGRLAGVYKSNGLSRHSFTIKAPSSVPAVSVVIWVLSYAAVIYNVFKYTRKDKNGKERIDAQQENH